MRRRERILRDVLPPDLLRAFQIYVREIAQTPLMIREEWAGRVARHNDPFAVEIHRRLTPLVEEHLKRPVKRSYAYLASYQDGARVTKHVDREQCRYTLDLCIEDSGGRASPERGSNRGGAPRPLPPWPLYVEGRPAHLRSGDAVLYFGCEQPHYRFRKPAGKVANLVFLHFVDPDFEGDLD